MTSKEIKKILSLAKQFNVSNFKFGDLEFTLHPQSGPQVLANKFEGPRLLAAGDEDLSAKMPPDDEMLHFSTPYFDELKKQRAEG